MESIKIFNLAERYHKLFPKNDMLAVKQNGKMRKYSTSEYIETTNNIDPIAGAILASMFIINQIYNFVKSLKKST